MPNRENVIKDLEKIHTHFWVKYRGCGIKAEKAMYKERLSAVADAIAMLKEQPEIVRCRDCKHRLDCDDWIINGDDWFCADGERR